MTEDFEARDKETCRCGILAYYESAPKLCPGVTTGRGKWRPILLHPRGVATKLYIGYRY